MVTAGRYCFCCGATALGSWRLLFRLRPAALNCFRLLLLLHSAALGSWRLPLLLRFAALDGCLLLRLLRHSALGGRFAAARDSEFLAADQVSGFASLAAIVEPVAVSDSVAVALDAVATDCRLLVLLSYDR